MLKGEVLGGAENFFAPFLSKCTTNQNLVVLLKFWLLSITGIVGNNQFAGFQEFSAPLRGEVGAIAETHWLTTRWCGRPRED
jgi:hypothetical protein